MRVTFVYAAKEIDMLALKSVGQSAEYGSRMREYHLCARQISMMDAKFSLLNKLAETALTNTVRRIFSTLNQVYTKKKIIKSTVLQLINFVRIEIQNGDNG